MRLTKRMVLVDEGPARVDTKSFAVLYGVSESRIRQLRGEGVLPPTLNGPDERAASWDRDVVVRFLAEQRRDEDNRTLRIPLLLPRSGVTWRLDGRRTINAETQGLWASDASTVASAHVMTYRADQLIGGCEATAHLVTVLAPHGPTVLAAASGESTVLEALLTQLHPDRPWADGDQSARPHRIAVAVLATFGYGDAGSWPLDKNDARVHVLEISEDSGLPTFEPWTRRLPSGSDIAATLGHPLPLWPHGHATAENVVAWVPHPQRPEPVVVEVPPFAADAHLVLRWTERAAPRYGPVGDHVRDMGIAMWQTQTNRLQPTRQGPVLPPGWVPAVRWSLPEPQGPVVDPMAGVDAVLSDPTAPRNIARLVSGYFGDPATFDVLTLRTDTLPAELRQALDDSIIAGPAAEPVHASWRLFNLQQALAEHTVDPKGVRGGCWALRPEPHYQLIDEQPEPDLLRGKDLDGIPHLAMHAPRDLPTELADGTINDRAVTLWIVRGATEGTAAFLLQTDDGLLTPLPVDFRQGAQSSAWWLARVARDLPPLFGPGGRLPESEPLVDVVRNAIDHPASAIPWSRVVSLAVQTECN